MPLTDEDLMEIHRRNQAKLQPLPSKIQEPAPAMRLCPICHEPLPQPPGRRVNIALPHKACLEKKQREMAERQKQAEADCRQAELDSIRTFPSEAMRQIGVPRHWWTADLDRCRDIPADIVGRLGEWAGNPFGMMYLYGGPGAGKTWAAVGAVKAAIIAGLYRTSDCLFISERSFLDGIKTTFDGGPSISPASRVGLLILDDLAASRLTDWGRSEIAGLIEHRHAADLVTVITSNLDPDGLGRAIDPRVVSRIAESQMMFHFPDKDLRIHADNANA